ncbi:MEDS domain-containing protein [Actinomadura parmotrematis]|uniref:MEDS domain-containing protein n=1 Tax=Actinomadura parmotrematis TaxID=2864039 RepID=A0ABS7FTU3_9ACTN|nr:MEDS domain-containing protein [Actinomadura parmotrematis]MBW8483829.1 MEDS domain-containing protein [Actinomadura parmotrematis]
MDETWHTKRAVSGVRPGDHALLPYGDLEERDRVMGTYVDDALTGNEKVVYVTDAPADRLPGLRPRTRARLDRYTRSRQLVVLSRADACLDARGRFAPGRLLDTLGREVGSTDAEGFRATRWTTDFSWMLDGRPLDVAAMLGCEHRLGDTVGPSAVAMAICQIDRRVCPPAQYAALRDTHEVLVEVDPRFDDGNLKIVQTFRPAGLRLEGELDHARHHVFEDELARVARLPGAVHLDLARLAFLDLGSLHLMAGLAADRTADAPLVLDDLPPGVLNIIEMVGWHRLPGLVQGRTAGFPNGGTR